MVVEEGHKGEAGRSAEALQEVGAAGGVERLFIPRFVDRDVGGEEILVEDRLDVLGLDKPIEFFAPASPGGVKDDEDGSAMRGSLGIGENGIGRRRGLRVESGGERKRGDNRAGQG